MPNMPTTPQLLAPLRFFEGDYDEGIDVYERHHNNVQSLSRDVGGQDIASHSSSRRLLPASCLAAKANIPGTVIVSGTAVHAVC